MGNRRIILFLLLGIALCAALLWGFQRRPFPAGEKTRAALLAGAPLDTVTDVTIDRGDTRIGVRWQDGKWAMTAPFAAPVEQGAVARLLDAFEAARVTDAMTAQEL
ncbi:MAG: hypothetical protein LBW77_00025, partial [Verrucomicrobiota bacterium]|nr:hypothetical protein [Verrucomicrobiota bacterium]